MARPSHWKWRRGFIKDRRGGVMVEFAFMMPILILVMLAGVDIIRFAMLQQKLGRAAITMADLVSQYTAMSQTQLTQLFLAAEHVIAPFPLGDNGRVIVSSISRASASSPIVVDWQRAEAGTATAASKFGTEGNPATLPTGFTLAAGQNLIVAEVFYDFEPLLYPQIIPPRRVEHRAMFRPRFGALSVLN